MKISIIIPAFNEAELLPRCLAAIIPQAQALQAEVIVIDNNSTDQTATIARQAGAIAIRESQSGYVFAMQRGLREAQGDVVAFTDADSIVAPGWLEAIRTAFADRTVVGTTGPIRFDRYRWLSWWRIGAPASLVGSNMAVRRVTALGAGGFDVRFNLGSDLEFGRRLTTLGRVIALSKMRVTTSSRRFQAHPFREGFRYVVNFAWMQAFHRPLFWHFAPIRYSPAELAGQERRRLWLTTGLSTIVVLLYLSLWPTASDFHQVIAKGKTRQKFVALTFDDGPNGAATRAMVDILLKTNAPATFFEVGRSVAADPQTARFVSRAGFPVENHSWDHSFRLPVMTPKHIHDELARTSAAIFSATGQTPTLFRPPHGFRSPELLYEADRLHLQVVNWSVDPQDYNTGNSQLIVRRVMRHVRHGSIILLHDGLQDGLHVVQLRDRRGTIAALPILIDQLRAKGYTIVPLTKLLPPPEIERGS